MRIQEEAPLPLSPLATLESDYEMAVVHLAWNRRRGGAGKEDERTLLFAFVELIPTEIPPPVDDYDPKDRRSCERLGGKSEHFVHVRHAVVPARDALDWYLRCRRGVAVLPGYDGSFPAEDAEDARRLRLADLGEAPPWPTLICAEDDTDTIPFAPGWAKCPRVHHLLTLADFDLDGLWSRTEQEGASAWLEDHLHFSLEEYPEYWGSVHLVAPNPVFREIDAVRQKRPPSAESVLLRFEPRAGKRVEGLDLIYRGTYSSGTLYAHTVPVQSELMRMRFENRSHAFQTDVVDPARGMLINANLLRVFIDGFKMNVHVGSTHEVKEPTPESTYMVHRSSPDRSSPGEPLRTVETIKVASAARRLETVRVRRRRRVAAGRRKQQWFTGQQEEARDILRGLFHEAKREILVVDSDFAHLDLWMFTLAVEREDVPVRVLTSANGALKEKTEQGGQVVENGDLLLAQIDHLRSQPHMNPFEIRVTTGDRPVIHDRFLLIDDQIWLLGSSLNEFGSRGTMMVALPDPEPARDQLVKAWDEAKPLAAWLEDRKKSRIEDGGRGP